MKAIVQTVYGSTDVLQLAEVSPPPVLSGEAAQFPQITVLILTTCDDDFIIDALHFRQTQRPLASNLPSQPLPPPEDLGLSERELEIARQIALGLSAKEISKTTFLSLGTVKNYISSIYAKIGVNDRAKAMIVLREILNL